MARKSFVATVVGIAAFAVPNAFADKGGIPHAGSNGQGRSATQQQQKAATAPHGKALAKGHAKSHSNAKANHSHANADAQAKSHGKSEASKPSTEVPQGPPPSNTHAKAGKTTICHATGSATNPFVTITISNNALPAHRRHQDGRDIIPAPAGGCPTGQETQTEETPPPTTETQTAAGQVLGETVTGSSPSKSGPTSTPAGGVLGATTSGSSPSASASPAATGTRASSSGSLPFTGTDAIIVAILGLAALLLGVTMRRAATHKA